MLHSRSLATSPIGGSHGAWGKAWHRHPRGNAKMCRVGATRMVILASGTAKTLAAQTMVWVTQTMATLPPLRVAFAEGGRLRQLGGLRAPRCSTALCILLLYHRQEGSPTRDRLRLGMLSESSILVVLACSPKTMAPDSPTESISTLVLSTGSPKIKLKRRRFLRRTRLPSLEEAGNRCANAGSGTKGETFADSRFDQRERCSIGSNSACPASCDSNRPGQLSQR